MKKQDFDSYWKNTSSFESINTFITMNYEGLKDDALTALIHLGYLGYDEVNQSVFIPNGEVRAKFVKEYENIIEKSRK